MKKNAAVAPKADTRAEAHQELWLDTVDRTLQGLDGYQSKVWSELGRRIRDELPGRIADERQQIIDQSFLNKFFPALAEHSEAERIDRLNDVLKKVGATGIVESPTLPLLPSWWPIRPEIPSDTLVAKADEGDGQAGGCENRKPIEPAALVEDETPAEPDRESVIDAMADSLEEQCGDRLKPTPADPERGTRRVWTVAIIQGEIDTPDDCLLQRLLFGSDEKILAAANAMHAAAIEAGVIDLTNSVGPQEPGTHIRITSN